MGTACAAFMEPCRTHCPPLQSTISPKRSPTLRARGRCSCSPPRSSGPVDVLLSVSDRSLPEKLNQLQRSVPEMVTCLSKTSTTRIRKTRKTERRPPAIEQAFCVLSTAHKTPLLIEVSTLPRKRRGRVVRQTAPHHAPSPQSTVSPKRLPPPRGADRRAGLPYIEETASDPPPLPRPSALRFHAVENQVSRSPPLFEGTATSD